MEPSNNRERKYFVEFLNYLVNNENFQLQLLLQAPRPEDHHPFNVNFMQLLNNCMESAMALLTESISLLPIFDGALVKAQEILLSDNDSILNPRTVYIVKKLAHVRLFNLPICPELHRFTVPRSGDTNNLIMLSGTIVRTGEVRVEERYKVFECTKCFGHFKVFSDDCLFDEIPKPLLCQFEPPESDKGEEDPRKSVVKCTGTNFNLVKTEASSDLFKSVQEIRLQEHISKLAMGTMPRWISVVLKDDLCDLCKPGNDVSITGTVVRRWKRFKAGVKCELEMVLLANGVQIHNNGFDATSEANEEIKQQLEEFWRPFVENPLQGRNVIVNSFCPHVFGMHYVKLAVLLTLLGGVAKESDNGIRTRGETHLLLVGDPGTGKSQFMKSAAKLVSRSVVTTGIGSTSAGLTVTATKDNGEWHLEAGALVLADCGVCCIDEFSSIRESDRTAIHEAMEQQTLSVAKAGIVCKLNTRCAIIAATNPKGQYDPDHDISVNVALASPLLSRFDLIMILTDRRDDEWDMFVADHVLNVERIDKKKTGTGNSSNATPNSQSSSQSNWPVERLKSYLNFCKGHFKPELTEEASIVLSRYYEKQRSGDGRSAGRTTIRLLESLIRLSQAHAKLMFRNKVLLCDAVVVILLMETSLVNPLGIFQGALNFGHSPSRFSFPATPELAKLDYIEKETLVLDKLGIPFS